MAKAHQRTDITMRLKFFSDRRFLPSHMDPDPILYPFWLEDTKGLDYSWLRMYDRYINKGHEIFEFSSLEEADFAVIPANWRTVRGDSWRSKVDKEAEKLAIEFSRIVEQAKKPLVLFFSGDCSDEEVPIQNTKVFRISAYRSQLKPNNFVPPAFCEDVVEFYFQNQLPVRQKQDKPCVGFCGFTRSDSLKRKVQTLAYHGNTLVTQRRLGVSPYRGQILRTKAIDFLAQSQQVETNFILRETPVFFEAEDLEYKKKVRMDFFQNIMDSDYTLCCRGSANYSNRFYEVLSSGRIPVFINTDCVLPFESEIDWKKYCVWVEEDEIEHIAEKVAEFHSALSPQEFLDLQYGCRKLWQEWLSPEGFYSNFYRHFS